MNARQLAFQTLRLIYNKGAFADVALDRTLRKAELSDADRRLLTELVYGVVRRRRTLDALINQLGKKKAHQQQPDIRVILHIGLYQLRYLDHIPDPAVVHSTVELTKKNGLARLKGFVNGFLRQYIRLAASGDPLWKGAGDLSVTQLGIQHSYPDWIVEVWSEQLGLAETEQLCEYLNQPPPIDLRVNALRTSSKAIRKALQAVGCAAIPLPLLPQAVRITSRTGPIEALPGFHEGEWVVQDSSAQLVSHLLEPQPGEVIIDACAAPGGKTTHIAELMQDEGIVWACDRYASRLRKVQANARRLGLQSIRLREADSRHMPAFHQQADRVLLDAPCSGLGTLNRHADARWRQTPERVAELVTLQRELLTEAAKWVKPGGVLVYATCTLHPDENEHNIQHFLAHHPQWRIVPPPAIGQAPAGQAPAGQAPAGQAPAGQAPARQAPARQAPARQARGVAPTFVTPEGWIKVWPHRDKMDGFFMVRLQYK